MSKRMKKNIDFLSQLKRGSKAERKNLIANSNASEMSTICEMSKNLLGSRFNLKPKQKLKLCRYKKLYRQLASRKTSLDSKRKKLQTGGFPGLGLLLGTLGPLVGSLI